MTLYLTIDFMSMLLCVIPEPVLLILATGCHMLNHFSCKLRDMKEISRRHISTRLVTIDKHWEQEKRTGCCRAEKHIFKNACLMSLRVAQVLGYFKSMAIEEQRSETTKRAMPLKERSSSTLVSTKEKISFIEARD